MSELPILEGILKYVKEENISFCMPGHKGGRGFANTPIGKEFIESFLKCDVTEVDGLDNLHNSEGIIKEAQQLLSDFYGSKKSYFLVNGSTSGNLAMIFSCFNEGDKIIVERNCHRSIFNAIIMRKLRPVYVKNIIIERLNAPLSMDLEHFSQVLDNNRDAKGIVVTYPNYYGICGNLKYIIEQGNKHGIRVLVDSAHGSHFGIHENLPESAVRLGADMIVTSTHKTLPSLTQTSYLHINNGQDIKKTDFYVSALLSTSPSYLFLCAMDYARFYLNKYGKEQYGRILDICSYYRNKINEIEGIYILGKEDINSFNQYINKTRQINDYTYGIDTILDIDTTRYVINLRSGYSGHLLLKYLKKHGIQGEMSDNSNVVLIFSPFNDETEFKKLYTVLKKCNLDELKDKDVSIVNFDIPKIELLPYEVMEKEKEYETLQESLGRISGSNIVPYPPGVPILVMGEVIDKNCLDAIFYCKNNGLDILGIKNDKIEVMKCKLESDGVSNSPDS
ncbi:aminotransferase class I/II-fold pyridoxal phosphate-dependent enzyme [Clostridium magnum]|uniref:Arginine decarboxylase n=1 Tax=Clostridium magnum DSM 2767 TaxID=1121326 RepID=A0A161X781_9CLOT|nr:aminotransferase class V-fold PLP-dependent enzyme [Clostridium magnum]KZL89966.1 arginine decarboxylase [Clostridium magnum DSM 2767]SHJ32737.1 Arginine/lysine/ornithine decarboxylase [Clostridium magnum DSM 2767]